MLSFSVKKEESGQRIDKYLRKQLNNAPLSLLYKLFRKKDVKVNAKRVNNEYLVAENDYVEVYISAEYLDKYCQPKQIHDLKQSFKVIYEDDKIIIVDKPAGLSLHQDEHEATNTLANQVLAYCVRKGDSRVVAPAHRLDRNTSGLVIFGKDMETLHVLNEMFKTRVGLHKYYQALTFNKLEGRKLIEAPLLKDEINKMVKIDKNGLTAKSIVEPILTNADYSLVKVEILTGRTHQIRVHLAYTGLPIVGDQKYGDFTKNKIFAKQYGWHYQFLHAYKLQFTELEGQLSYLSKREFSSELPTKKQALINKLFQNDSTNVL